MPEDAATDAFVASLLGQTLADRYLIVRFIGHGATGVVFEGKHTWTDRPVAVKVLRLPPEYADGTLAARFLREAKAAASLPHRNVVDVLDMGQAFGMPFMVLELLQGEALSSLLAREKTISVERTLAILLPVLDALSSAHARGMVHRDVKAENIFLHRDEAGAQIPKVLDFGTVWTEYREGEAALTAQGMLLGTTHYMSPEQITSRPVDAYTDIWAAGVLAYRMLTGTFPYDGPVITLILADIVTKPFPPIASRAPGLAPGIASAIEKALQKSPTARHKSMYELLDALLEGAREVGLSPLDPRDRVSLAR